MRKLVKYYLLLLVLFNCKALISQSQNPRFQNIDSLKAVLKTAKEDSNKVKASYWLARNYQRFSSDSLYITKRDLYMDTAIRYAKFALELCEKISFRTKGFCLGLLAEFYLNSNPPESLKYHYAALKVFQADGNQLAVANTYHNMANIYINSMGDYSEALKCNFAALEIRKKMNHKYYIWASHIFIGNIYYRMGKYEQALNYALLCFKDKNLNGKDTGGIYISVGRCYAQLGNFDESLKYLNTGLKTFQQAGSNLGVSMANLYLGIRYVKIASQLSSAESKEIYLNALEHLNKALPFFPRETYPVLAEVYKKLGDFEKALEYKNRLTLLNDSIFNYETQNRLAHVRIEYETEQALAMQKGENEKYIIEERSRQAVFLAEEKAYREKLLFERKLEQEKAIEHEKFLHEKKASEARSRYDNQIVLEKAKQERLELEKEQTKLGLLFGIIGVSVIFCLSIILIRQKVSKRRAIEKAEAQHKMAELELQSLRAQLNPHFMFNSLNAIQELILKDDNDNSHLYLSRFSELLRVLLDNANQSFVSIRKEINLLELYLSLENLRIPDLKYSIEVDPSIDTNKMTIPNMMLQPYIENAIWHGLSPKKGDRNLSVRIRRKEELIVCEVEDNGVGRKVAAELKSLYRKEHRSKGMELLSKRFSLLSKEYGSDIQTIVEDLHDNGTALGTKVSITVPYSLTEQVKPVYS